MLKKEDVGHLMAKAARVLPGIGSYQDRESSREADKSLRMNLSGRINGVLARVEGLKAGFAKKGGIRKLLPLEDLSRYLEKVSRELQFASRGYSPIFSRKQIDEVALDRIYKCDKGLLGQVTELEEAVKILSGKTEPEWDADIEPICGMLLQMERSLEKRDLILKA